ncbi:MAG TPA: tetratricopeptide repeat protein [Microvirga sp.]|jgi:YaiO family outer membrane protein
MRQAALAAAFTVGVLLAPAAAQTGDPDALYKAGIAARDAGRPDDAIRQFERVLAIQPDNVDARVQLGFSLMARRRFAEAERAFRRVLDQAPSYDDARLGLARIAFFQNDLARAERELAALRERAPGNAEARALAAQVGRAREAARAAAVAAARQRRLDQARAARRNGRFAEAERLFRAAVSEQSQAADLWVDLGLAIAFQGRFAEARTAFERALALAPGNLDAVLGLARIDLYTNALDSADARIAQVLAGRPGDRDARALQARVRLARGDAEGAEADFRALAAAAPGELDYQLGLGDALRARGEDEAAREVYLVAERIDPNAVDVRNRLAQRVRPRWRLDIVGSYSDLTQGLESWREGRVALGYRFDQRTAVTAGVEVNHRFGRTDAVIDGRIDQRWNERLGSYLRTGGTPDADFRPEFLAETGGSLRFAPGNGPVGATLGLLDLSYARYATGETKGASVGLQQYVLDGRIWLTGRLIGTISETDERLGGYSIQADWRVTDRVGLTVGYADAPDTSEGRTFETQSLFGGISLDVTEDLTLRLTGSRETRRNSYDRTTINLGLTTRF